MNPLDDHVWRNVGGLSQSKQALSKIEDIVELKEMMHVTAQLGVRWTKL